MVEKIFRCPFCNKRKHHSTKVNRDFGTTIVKAYTKNGLLRGNIDLPKCAIGKKVEIKVIEMGLK